MKAVIAHKSFDWPDSSYVNNQYTVFTPRRISTNLTNVTKFKSELDDRIWSEWSAIYYIYKNIKDDFIEINHYRRKIETYENHNCVITPMRFNYSVAGQYGICHNIADLNTASAVVKQFFPKMFDIFVQICQNNVLIPYNLVNFSYAIFKEWVEFVVTVCSNVLKQYNIETYADMLNHVTNDEAYTKGKTGQNADVKYQARMVSFLSERLTTAFVYQMLALKMPIYFCDVTLLEHGQHI